jgi:hypothetical protein
MGCGDHHFLGRRGVAGVNDLALDRGPFGVLLTRGGKSDEGSEENCEGEFHGSMTPQERRRNKRLSDIIQ